MTKPCISIIVAHAKNRVIGKANKLLWHISDDLKRFKTLTTGHPIIMGRKTYESIGKPLPNRTNIIVSRNINELSGCFVYPSLESAIEKVGEIDKEEIFIIGGGEIYRQALPLADRLYVTKVDLNIEGDTYFPEYEKDFTKEIYLEERFDDKTSLNYVWRTLER